MNDMTSIAVPEMHRASATGRSIVFENAGEIDMASICTFGVSVKEGDNPIGFFGTGLKYALAILLRTNHQVTIWSGLRRVNFDTEKVAIRGQTFSLVTMNGERTGFTTEVGKTWDLWMAYRELFCNARDEGGEAWAVRGAPDPAPGKTLIVVSGDDFAAVHTDRWQYFIEDEPERDAGSIQVWQRPSRNYFYRGVRVDDLPYQALFTYCDTQKIELTEDRTVKNSYEVPHRIARGWLRSTDKEMLRQVLTAGQDWLEHHLDFQGWGTQPTAEFMEVTGELAAERPGDLNKTAKKLWEDKQPNVFAPKLATLSAVQQATLERALTFCERIGFEVRDYPLVVVQSLGKDKLGLARDRTIYVAERAFHMGGAKQVAATLIEEFVHLRHDYADMTREMQNWLFERMVSIGEELVGAPL